MWHTHLKKRLEKYQTKPNPKTKSKSKIKSKSKSDIVTTRQSESGNSSSSVSDSNVILSRTEIPAGQTPMSPDQSSSSEFSSVTDATPATTDREANNNNMAENYMDSWDWIPEIDESFWSDALSSDEFQSQYHHVPSSSSIDHVMEPNNGYGQNLGDAMEFWYDMFIEAGGEEELFTEL